MYLPFELAISAQQKPLKFNLELDHINIAVRNLDSAENIVKKHFGFSIKKGNLHKNSSLNAFAKFKDGTLIEFITASDSIDRLSKQYLEIIDRAPLGKASFISLRIDDIEVMKELSRKLNKAKIKNEFHENKYFSTISIIENSKYYPIFFIFYKTLTSDLKIHLKHKNTTLSLNEIWLAVNQNDMVFGHLFGNIEESRAGCSMQSPYQKIYLRKSIINFRYHSGETKLSGISLLVENLDIAKKYIEEQLKIKLVIQSLGKFKKTQIKPEYFFGIRLELVQKM